eukprot:scaffold127247_cov57-Phaeocystis_antarctica.AAC.1
MSRHGVYHLGCPGSVSSAGAISLKSVAKSFQRTWLGETRGLGLGLGSGSESGLGFVLPAHMAQPTAGVGVACAVDLHEASHDVPVEGGVITR